MSVKKLKKVEIEHEEEEQIEGILFVKFEEIPEIFKEVLDPKDKLALLIALARENRIDIVEKCLKGKHS